MDIAIGWFREWKAYGVLPYGTSSLLEEPAYVFEAIDLINGEIESMKAENHKRAQSEHEAAIKKARR